MGDSGLGEEEATTDTNHSSTTTNSKELGIASDENADSDVSERPVKRAKLTV